MNDNVGNILKKIAKIEWIIGLVLVGIETIVMIVLFVALKPYITNLGYMSYYMGGPNYSGLIYVGIVLAWLLSVSLTVYSFYKRKLLVYAYGKLSADVDELKRGNKGGSEAVRTVVREQGKGDSYQRLVNLLNEGVITQEEFEDLKKQL